MHSIAHFSHYNRPTMLKMGLQPISNDEWIEPFDEACLSQFVAHKRTMLDADSEAILYDERARAALVELEDILRDYLDRKKLPALHSHVSGAVPDCISGQELLKEMSFWVPDDICILQPQSELGLDGEDYVLSAASVLSPSHWSPKEKFLKPLAAIHAPIPDFDSELTPKVTRFFNHLKVGKPVVRYNWGIQSGAALNWQTESEPEQIHPSTTYYRSERQTLLRLSKTGAVVFFIRIDLCPLEELAVRYQDLLALDKLKAFIRDMPPQQRAYKGIDRFYWLLD